MAECVLCGTVPHQRACAVRLDPGWRLPPRVACHGGPVLADPPAEVVPLGWRSRRVMLADPAARSRLITEAAALRAEGRSWVKVAAELGLPLSTARDLALEGGA